MIRKNLKFTLTSAIYCSILVIMTIKEAVEKELKRRAWSRYDLVKELKDKIPARTIYAYLAGDMDLTTEKASIILKTLGLKIKR